MAKASSPLIESAANRRLFTLDLANWVTSCRPAPMACLQTRLDALNGQHGSQLTRVGLSRSPIHLAGRSPNPTPADRCNNIRAARRPSTVQEPRAPTSGRRASLEAFTSQANCSIMNWRPIVGSATVCCRRRHVSASEPAPFNWILQATRRAETLKGVKRQP